MSHSKFAMAKGGQFRGWFMSRMFLDSLCIVGLYLALLVSRCSMIHYKTETYGSVHAVKLSW